MLRGITFVQLFQALFFIQELAVPFFFAKEGCIVYSFHGFNENIIQQPNHFLTSKNNTDVGSQSTYS